MRRSGLLAASGPLLVLLVCSVMLVSVAHAIPIAVTASTSAPPAPAFSTAAQQGLAQQQPSTTPAIPELTMGSKPATPTTPLHPSPSSQAPGVAKVTTSRKTRKTALSLADEYIRLNRMSLRLEKLKAKQEQLQKAAKEMKKEGDKNGATRAHAEAVAIGNELQTMGEKYKEDLALFSARLRAQRRKLKEIEAKEKKLADLQKKLKVKKHRGKHKAARKKKEKKTRPAKRTVTEIINSRPQPLPQFMLPQDEDDENAGSEALAAKEQQAISDAIRSSRPQPLPQFMPGYKPPATPSTPPTPTKTSSNTTAAPQQRQQSAAPVETTVTTKVTYDKRKPTHSRVEKHIHMPRRFHLCNSCTGVHPMIVLPPCPGRKNYRSFICAHDPADGECKWIVPGCRQPAPAKRRYNDFVLPSTITQTDVDRIAIKDWLDWISGKRARPPRSYGLKVFGPNRAELESLSREIPVPGPAITKLSRSLRRSKKEERLRRKHLMRFLRDTKRTIRSIYYQLKSGDVMDNEKREELKRELPIKLNEMDMVEQELYTRRTPGQQGIVKVIIKPNGDGTYKTVIVPVNRNETESKFLRKLAKLQPDPRFMNTTTEPRFPINVKFADSEAKFGVLLLDPNARKASQRVLQRAASDLPPNSATQAPPSPAPTQTVPAAPKPATQQPATVVNHPVKSHDDLLVVLYGYVSALDSDTPKKFNIVPPAQPQQWVPPQQPLPDYIQQQLRQQQQQQQQQLQQLKQQSQQQRQSQASAVLPPKQQSVTHVPQLNQRPPQSQQSSQQAPQVPLQQAPRTQQPPQPRQQQQQDTHTASTSFPNHALTLTSPLAQTLAPAPQPAKSAAPTFTQPSLPAAPTIPTSDDPTHCVCKLDCVVGYECCCTRKGARCLKPMDRRCLYMGAVPLPNKERVINRLIDTVVEKVFARLAIRISDQPLIEKYKRLWKQHLLTSYNSNMTPWEKAKRINSLVNGAFDGILVPPVDAPVIEKYKRRMKRLALGQLEKQYQTRLLHHGDLVYEDEAEDYHKRKEWEALERQREKEREEVRARLAYAKEVDDMRLEQVRLQEKKEKAYKASLEAAKAKEKAYDMWLHSLPRPASPSTTPAAPAPAPAPTQQQASATARFVQLPEPAQELDAVLP